MLQSLERHKLHLHVVGKGMPRRGSIDDGKESGKFVVPTD